jgi:hypothetical protein
VSVVCCQVEVFASVWSLVQRSPTGCDVSECDHKSSTFRRPKPSRGCQSCYIVLFYLTTALHVSGVTITHLQEHKTTVTTTSGNRYTVLLSAAIVEELELV